MLRLKFNSTNSRNLCTQHACVHCLAHYQLTMEQLPAHKALSGLYPPKRCFLPSAESYIEHGFILQMAATAAHLVKAAESIALVFQERLMTRDPCYFMGKFQQLNPWAVSYIYLFTEKWCTIATHTSEQNVGIKSEKKNQLSGIWCLFKCSLNTGISEHFLDILHRLSKSKTFSGILPEILYHLKKEAAPAGKPVLLVPKALYVISHTQRQKNFRSQGSQGPDSAHISSAETKGNAV